ncbi:MAG TPA: HU family DNA-binding protein [Bryobacteraceae bacterium]|jgi:nucleoid DNA-binding protein|nr:HU family DNA-binding protein [Bryobacteraceae bacterium]
MRKSDLANDLAKQRGLKTGVAADQMDRAVTRIVRALRQGRAAHLPGLGTITPGSTWTFRPTLPD